MATKEVSIDENGDMRITYTPDPYTEVIPFAVMEYRKSDLEERKAKLEAELAQVNDAIAELEGQVLAATEARASRLELPKEP